MKKRGSVFIVLGSMMLILYVSFFVLVRFMPQAELLGLTLGFGIPTVGIGI
jgi:uncharacterized membrane protein (DUF485 family)